MRPTPPMPGGLDPVELTRRLVSKPPSEGADIARTGGPPLPDAAAVRELAEALRRLVFPGFFGTPPADTQELERTQGRELGRAVTLTQRALEAAYRCDPAVAGSEDCRTKADTAAAVLLESLPELRARLALDVQAAIDGDPAAQSVDEIVTCYPGIDAVFAYRVARVLDEHSVPLIPRMICEQAHARTGIDIHPGARIGERFFIDHGAGVVIGQTCCIGDGVKLYQGVTLGARSFPVDERGALIRGTKRHPTIGDRVTIYAGAVVLGGDTVIGDDCVISGGVFVSRSVPAGQIVRQKQPELVVGDSKKKARG